MREDRPEVITNPITNDGLCGYDARNQFWIYWRDDMGTLIGTLMADLRQHKCLLCKQGWKTCSVSLRDQMFAREARSYVHKSCYYNYLNFREHARMRELFAEGGLDDLRVEKIEVIPNQYGGGWNTDWFNVTLKFPMKPILQFGARRRVDAILLTRLSVPQRDLIWAALADENTTKENTSDSFMIHAHSHADVVRYFQVFLKVLVLTVEAQPAYPQHAKP